MLVGNFAYMLSDTLHLGIFYMPQNCDFPSEGSRAEDFFVLKNTEGFGRV